MLNCWVPSWVPLYFLTEFSVTSIRIKLLSLNQTHLTKTQKPLLLFQLLLLRHISAESHWPGKSGIWMCIVYLSRQWSNLPKSMQWGRKLWTQNATLYFGCSREFFLIERPFFLPFAHHFCLYLMQLHLPSQTYLQTFYSLLQQMKKNHCSFPIPLCDCLHVSFIPSLLHSLSPASLPLDPSLLLHLAFSCPCFTSFSPLLYIPSLILTSLLFIPFMQSLGSFSF